MKIKFYLRLLVFTLLGLVNTQWATAQNVTISPQNGSMICALTDGSPTTQLGFQMGAFGTWRHNQLSLTMTGSNYTTTEDGQLTQHSNHFISGDKCTYSPADNTRTPANYICTAWGSSGNTQPGYITIALPKGYRFTGYTFHLSHDVSTFGQNSGSSTSFRITTDRAVTMTENNPANADFSGNLNRITLDANSAEVKEFKRTGDDMGNILYFTTTAGASGFYAIAFRYVELTFTADADASISILPGSQVSTGASMLEVPFNTGKVDLGQIQQGTYQGATRVSYQYNSVTNMPANMLLYEEESVKDGIGFDGTSGKVAYNQTGHSITTEGHYFKFAPDASKDEQVYFLETPVSAMMAGNIENPVQFRITGATINYTNEASESFHITCEIDGTTYYLGTNGRFSTDVQTVWQQDDAGHIHSGTDYIQGTNGDVNIVQSANNATIYSITDDGTIRYRRNNGSYRYLKAYPNYTWDYSAWDYVLSYYSGRITDSDEYTTATAEHISSTSSDGATIYVYDKEGKNPKEIKITKTDNYSIPDLNNDAIKFGVKGGDVALLNFTLQLQALNPYIDQMTVVMNDTDNGKNLRMTQTFTADDFSVGGGTFRFYLPTDCKGDDISMTFEDLYSKYGDETYDHTTEKGNSSSRYNFVKSQHNLAFTNDNIYNAKDEAASATLESERIANKQNIRTQVGTVGNQAFRFNNADELATHSGYMTEYPFTLERYANQTNPGRGQFIAASFVDIDGTLDNPDRETFYVFTTDETRYNIAPTTATQHRFYAFYEMIVELVCENYDPVVTFEKIYDKTFYDNGTDNATDAFYGVVVTAPENIPNGLASDVATYKAISEKLGGTDAPADLKQILYLDMSKLNGVYHATATTEDADYALNNFNELKDKLAANALVFLPINSTATFNNFAYAKKGEVAGSFQSANNIILTDKQPFYSPYDIQVDAQNNVKYTRGLSKSTYTSAKRTTLILPFTIKLTNGINSDGSLKFFQLQPNNAAKDNVDNYGPAMLFEPTSDTKVQANTPYALENLNGETEFTITESGSNIVATPAAAKSGNSFFSAEEMTSTGSLGGQSYTFNHVGTYSGRELSKTTTFFYFANGGFYSSSDLSSNYNTVKAYPFRSIYTTGTNPTAKIGYIYFLEGFYDDATGIKDVSKSLTGISVGDGTITITADADNSYRIYSTTGQNIDAVSLKAGESRTVSVPAGIYLVNGVKVLVK